MCNIMIAQTAKSVLDKIAATISSRTGVTANFKISNVQNGGISGTISVK